MISKEGYEQIYRDQSYENIKDIKKAVRILIQRGDDKVRGRLDFPSKDEHEFWENFPGLGLDDPEVSYNDLIAILRNISIKYWKEKAL